MAETDATSLYDFGIPPTDEIRKRIRSAAEKQVVLGGLTPPLSIGSLEQSALEVLSTCQFDKSWLAYAMIAVNNALWQPVINRLSPRDCLFLLPHCVRKKDRCEGEYDDYGFVCADCRACELAEAQTQAEKLGYTVLISEATAMVEDAIERGVFEAVIGVGCLESLGKTFERMLDKALPGLAVPLLRGGCDTTELDTVWLREILTADPSGKPVAPAPPFGLAAMRELRHEVTSWFDYDLLSGFLNQTGEPTERLATQWVSAQGKRWRPFLMAACERAMADHESRPGADSQRLGVAIECFHKASLIHDDIEDEDVERGGRACLHVEAGVATALNVGDFLIGEGYRLAAECGLPAAKRIKILGELADCHRRLCLGQGREFDVLARSSVPATAELEDLFALKTSPAFEAALVIGAVLADAEEETLACLRRFSRVAGIAYQIKDDLGDSLLTARVSRRSLTTSLLVARWREIHADSGEAAGKKLRQVIREDAIQEWARDRLAHLNREALSICEDIDRLPLRQLLFRVTAKLLDDTPV
ncbi:MAG: polyprenyl synthetase family protein [Lentisphaeria bacterium]|nr:polyprenyl synthetase family protein [Lentisphaeria bacterium]